MEIRRGAEALRCKEFAESPDIKIAESAPGLALTIFHGNVFKLKMVCLIAKSEADYAAWTEGLEQYTRARAQELYTTDKIQLRWLKKTWQQLTNSNTHHITVREFKIWLQRANLKLATKETKDVFNSVDTYREGKISFPQFVELYHDLCDDTEMTQYFDRFSSDAVRCSSLASSQHPLATTVHDPML
jgi:hypothetical protein